MRLLSTVAWTATALMLLASCGGSTPARDVPDVPEVITVTSDAFDDGGSIPAAYTCDGQQLSPPLAWSGVPADAAAVALVVDDPDAPSGTFTHWVVLDIPTTTTSVGEGAAPAGGEQAENSDGDAAYTGPCPPDATHRYRFTVTALDERTGLPDGASLADALAAIDDHTIARGTLTGTFSRS